MHGAEFQNVPTSGASGEGPAARLISIEKAAELLGNCTRREIDLKVARGQLVKVKDGRRALITVDSLNTYIDSLLAQSGAAVAA